MSEAHVIGLHHIHIVCTDLAATERWFMDGLSAELIDHHDSRGTLTSELRLADVRVLLRGSRENEDLATDGRRRFGTDHFGLHVANVDSLVEQLRSRGVTIAIEPHDSPRNRVAFIKGPDNVLIELTQPRSAS